MFAYLRSRRQTWRHGAWPSWLCSVGRCVVCPCACVCVLACARVVLAFLLSCLAEVRTAPQAHRAACEGMRSAEALDLPPAPRESPGQTSAGTRPTPPPASRRARSARWGRCRPERPIPRRAGRLVRRAGDECPVLRSAWSSMKTPKMYSRIAKYLSSAIMVRVWTCVRAVRGSRWRPAERQELLAPVPALSTLR